MEFSHIHYKYEMRKENTDHDQSSVLIDKRKKRKKCIYVINDILKLEMP